MTGVEAKMSLVDHSPPRVSIQSRVIFCLQHGTSDWCYVQRDGSHIDSDRCRCFLMLSAFCPVDAHREVAAATAGHRSARAAD